MATAALTPLSPATTGVCPSCKLRAKGFEEAGYADPALVAEVL